MNRNFQTRGAGLLARLQASLPASDTRARLRITGGLAAPCLILLAQSAGGVIAVNRFDDFADPNLNNDICGLFAIGGGSHCSLRAAIQNVNAGKDDHIVVPAGIYELSVAGQNEDSGATGDLDLRETVFIEAFGGPVVIDAKGIDRVMDVDVPLPSCCITLVGLTLRGGAGVVEGGGLRITSGDVTLDGSSVISNEATFGGGVYAGEMARHLLLQSIVRSNSATLAGGGIFNESGLVGSTGLTVGRSTIAANTAPAGGGLYNVGGVFLDFATVSGNSLDGIYNETSALPGLALTEVTLSDNEGSAVENADGSNWSALNTILAGGCSGSGTLGSGSGNLESPGNSCGLEPGSNYLNVADPGLRPLGGYGGPTPTHALRSNSPARDAARDGSPCTTDQRLALRDDGHCDVGAFEFGALPPDGGIFADGFESGDTAPWSL